MSRRDAVSLRHQALASADGRPLTKIDLTDQQKIAVLLQAASLLSHLRYRGDLRVRAWEEARIDRNGLLRGVVLEPGPPEATAQAQLTLLATEMFRARYEIAGRGQARRIVRRLASLWSGAVVPLPPDEAVRQILDLAEFLWLPAHAAARSTLAAEHGQNGRSRLWVAGPWWLRDSLLGRSADLDELEGLLSSEGAVAFWKCCSVKRDRKMGRRSWWDAAVVGRRRSRSTPQERVACAETLAAVGRFSEAVDELRGVRSAEAVALRLRCLHRGAGSRRARREIAVLDRFDLSETVLQRAAASAVAVYVELEELERAESWVRRALAGAESLFESWAGELLAFAVATARGDRESMTRHLHAARAARRDRRTCWRWYKARACLEMKLGDGRAAAASLSRALIRSRRHLNPVQAGDLWSELAAARVLSGDLSGAERALRHLAWLHRELDSSGNRTQTLLRRAEVRIRRGLNADLEGITRRVSKTVGMSRSERRAGLPYDLRARKELSRGRPDAAIELVSTALSRATVERRTEETIRLRVLYARGLGWLGRSAEAKEQLAGIGDEGASCLDPEERPAVWALAGDRERALDVVGAGPAAGAWRSLLSGRRPEDEDWERATRLEDFRFARLVYDLFVFEPDSVPSAEAARAAAILRGVGADSLAEKLERAGESSWRSIERYLAKKRRNGRTIADLLRDLGRGEARLVLDRGEGEEIVVEGVGGDDELVLETEFGRLVLTARKVDPMLGAVLRLVAADIESPGSRASSRKRRGGKRFGIVGRATSLCRALDRLGRLAAGEVPVLLLGETGTGKELAARLVHSSSRRAERDFVTFNCAAVSEELLMSDLFGHVRGAFTGAVKDRAGVFESARGGSVFLDEIGDLPLRVQGFLLRVLQQGEVRRVGESVERQVDVRVVSATHRNLEEMVRCGDFRADLFFRLRGGRVVLPPLREREGDVLLLARHFLERSCAGSFRRLTPQSREALSVHDWPGNVRELENVLAAALAVAGDGAIDLEHLELPGRDTPVVSGYHERVLDFRRRLVREALVASDGNGAQAARSLGLTRQALSYLVHSLQVSI